MDAYEVTPGVHRIHSHEVVNWYLVENGGRLAAIDAGLPPDWDTLERVVRSLGRATSDLAAVVLTHAHVDHTGIAERARTEAGATVCLPDGDVLFTGDALVTRNPYTDETGPRLVSRAATASSEQALRSLDRIEATGAGTLLPGHGEPWTGGAEEAARLAREAGLS